MDFNYRVLIEESYNLGSATNGAFSYPALKDMDFSDYHYLIKIYNQANEKGGDNG